MKRKLFEVDSDCLEIVRRIKEIDDDYFVMFDSENHKFQLHSRSQKNTYCLTFPYDTLDERAVLYVLKTRVQNSDKIFAELEEENRKLEEKKSKEILNNFKEKLYESFRHN